MDMDNELAFNAPSLTSSTSTQMTSVEDRLKIIMSIGRVQDQDELMQLLANKKPQEPIICYDGFEPSRRMDIAQGVLKALNVNKLTSAGCNVKIWIADWFTSQLNNNNAKKVEAFGQYSIETWKALGMKLESGQVEFLWSSKEINSKPHEYWPLVLDIARTNKLPVRDDQNQDDQSNVAQTLFYPCMQCADMFFLKADICLLGMDQQNVNVYSREYSTKKEENKPIVLFHHMLPSLKEAGQGNDKESIYMDDEESEVNRKIKKAFCPPKVVEKNPCLEYIKCIVFPWFGEFEIQRKAVDGGDKTFRSFEELASDYESGNVHPADLKPALSTALNKILQPVRDHFNDDQSAKDLFKRVKNFRK